jgi:hypothetical protein
MPGGDESYENAEKLSKHSLLNWGNRIPEIAIGIGSFTA